jgi:hypothetical protein
LTTTAGRLAHSIAECVFVYILCITMMFFLQHDHDAICCDFYLRVFQSRLADVSRACVPSQTTGEAAEPANQQPLRASSLPPTPPFPITPLTRPPRPRRSPSQRPTPVPYLAYLNNLPRCLLSSTPPPHSAAAFLPKNLRTISPILASRFLAYFFNPNVVRVPPQV